MLLRYRLHGHHGPLGLACRLEVQILASVRLVSQMLVLRLVLVLRQQVLVHLGAVLQALVRLVLVRHQQVSVHLGAIDPYLGLPQKDCYRDVPSGEVCPCLGLKKMDYYLGAVCQASLQLQASRLREVERLPAHQ